MEWIPSPNKHDTRLRPVRLIVIHSTESPADRARANAYYLQDPSLQASAHYIVGLDAIVQCVSESATAWGAPGANADGIQIELCGWAASDWSGDGLRVIDIARPLVADIARRWGIPLRQLSDGELAAGARGIVTHAQISRVYKQSDHWDPGPRFPMDRLLAAPPAPTKPKRKENEMRMIYKSLPGGANLFALFGPSFWMTFTGQEAANNFAQQGGIERALKVSDAFWEHCKKAATEGIAER